MTKILDNISILADKEGITIGALEKQIGASKGVLSRAMTNGTDIQAKWIQAIVENYPNVSADWLLTGKGDMIKQKRRGEVAHQTNNSKEGIPLIPFSAMAGALKGEQTALMYECEHYIVPAFNGADFLMPVKGNSMTPTYLSGDIVACQRVSMNGIFFQWNKPYVLDTVQGAIIKRIKPGSDRTHVLLVSDNDDYDPYELSYDDIHAVALVIGLIRLE